MKCSSMLLYSVDPVKKQHYAAFHLGLQGLGEYPLRGSKFLYKKTASQEPQDQTERSEQTVQSQIRLLSDNCHERWDKG